MSDGFDPMQRASLIDLLRLTARGESTAETLRRRLQEESFDPWLAFKALQGKGANKGWLSAIDLFGWLATQPHNVPNLAVDDLAAAMAPFAAAGDELRYQDFLRMVLPRDDRSEAAPPPRSGLLHDIPPEAVHRFCELLSSEIDVARHLRHHRKRLLELGVGKAMVFQFLGADDGPGGGMVAPSSIRRVLVDRHRALDGDQCEALLRRVNPSGACMAPADELVKLLTYIPGGVRSPGQQAVVDDRSSYALPNGRYDFASFTAATSPAAPPPLRDSGAGCASPLSARGDLSWRSPQRRPSGDRSWRATPSTWRAPELTDWVGRSPCHTPRQEHWRCREGGDYKPYQSPAGRSTQASTADYMSPLSSRQLGSPQRTWREPRTLEHPLRPSSPPRRAVSPVRATSVPLGGPRAPSAAIGRKLETMSPLGARQATPVRSARAVQTPRESRQQNIRAVLQAVARQAELDSHLEDTKGLVFPSVSVESIFNVLDRFRKGYVADMDLWQFCQDFGAALSFGSFCSLVSEVQLRGQSRASTPNHLSLRDVGRLVFPLHSREYRELQEASSDAEALSALYLLRHSESCPGCSVRVQRDADAVGCPSVTCPRCGTSFRCFIVVSDYAVPTDASMPLPASSQYHVHKLLEAAARAAEEIGRDRRQLAALPNFDLVSTLADVFTHISDGRLSFTTGDLRRVFFAQDIRISEQELGYLLHRYAPNGREVTLPDFLRQLKRASPLKISA